MTLTCVKMRESTVEGIKLGYVRHSVIHGHMAVSERVLIRVLVRVTVDYVDRKTWH